MNRKHDSTRARPSAWVSSVMSGSVSRADDRKEPEDALTRSHGTGASETRPRVGDTDAPTLAGTKSPHTPGPWTAFDDEIVADRTDAHIATVALEDGINPTEWQANLHLIAAAPDLFKACRAALVVLPLTKDNDDVYRALAKALAKAEGGR